MPERLEAIIIMEARKRKGLTPEVPSAKLFMEEN
jgi:hypothetical protein